MNPTLTNRQKSIVEAVLDAWIAYTSPTAKEVHERLLESLIFPIGKTPSLSTVRKELYELEPRVLESFVDHVPTYSKSYRGFQHGVSRVRRFRPSEDLLRAMLRTEGRTALLLAETLHNESAAAGGER